MILPTHFTLGTHHRARNNDLNRKRIHVGESYSHPAASAKGWLPLGWLAAGSQRSVVDGTVQDTLRIPRASRDLDPGKIRRRGDESRRTVVCVREEDKPQLCRLTPPSDAR